MKNLKNYEDFVNENIKLFSETQEKIEDILSGEAEEELIEKIEDEEVVEESINEEEPHESGAYLQDGMPGDLDRNGHPIPAIAPDFSKMGLEEDTEESEE